MSNIASCEHRLEQIADYQRFFHTKSYIKNKSIAYKEEKRLMHVLGYRNIRKLRIHRNEWDGFERPVPLKYLSEIGVDLRTLQFTIELDQEEYDKALTFPLFPIKVAIQASPSSLSLYRFPFATSESDAVSLLRKMARRMNLRFLINYKNLKSIYFLPDGTTVTRY